MFKQVKYLLVSVLATLLLNACTDTVISRKPSWHMSGMVGSVQRSVVTVAAFDMDGEMSKIGSGFFVDWEGSLVTNYHVLDGAYKAEIKTANGRRYPIKSVIGFNQLVDLIKVRVQIPNELSVPVTLAENDPFVADSIVVIGSPMGFEQTISEGIVSAIREHPATGKVFQLTAPISPGSSGGPALNLNGEVFGVVTFQAAKGQNLNFAMSIQTMNALPNEAGELSLSEWTLRKSGHDPDLAASLCRRGTQLTIRGKYEAALEYFQQATEANPDDPDAWNGLGGCYIGLNQPDNAIAAYRHVINADPDNASAHFMLAMYYKTLESYQLAIAPLMQVIRIDAKNLQARLELADAYGKLNRTDAQLESLKGILKINPNHVPSLHMMGQTVGRIGRHDEALDFLLKASSLAPTNAQIHFDVGVTYRLKNKPEEELRAYTRAIRANPRLVPAHHNLGLLFLNQGNRKLALQQYEILRDLDEKTAESFFGKIYPQSLKEINKRHSIKY